MASVAELRVKLFADGADLSAIRDLASNPLIKGFTTNPTLMRKAHVDDYATFAQELLEVVPDRPISFEVFSLIISIFLIFLVLYTLVSTICSLSSILKTNT